MAAIARPYSGYYRGIARKAAALVHSLTLNHRFLDGNKRTAVHMLGVLLYRSGYTLEFDDIDQANDEVEAMVLAVAQHELDLDGITAWITARIKPRAPRAQPP